MLEAAPELAGANVYAAAATGSLTDLRRFLAEDPGGLNAEGGPHRWPPLLYLCYSRIPDAPPERSSLDCARLLLDAGADPERGVPVGRAGAAVHRADRRPSVAVRTGPTSRRTSTPMPLARLLLDAGADPNDGQTLYNRMFEDSDDHLRLLFDYGLGRGDGGPWRRRLGDAQQTPDRDAGRPADLGGRAGPDRAGRRPARQAASTRTRQGRAPDPRGPDRVRLGPAHRQHRDRRRCCAPPVPASRRTSSTRWTGSWRRPWPATRRRSDAPIRRCGRPPSSGGPVPSRRRWTCAGRRPSGFWSGRLRRPRDRRVDPAAPGRVRRRPGDGPAAGRARRRPGRPDPEHQFDSARLGGARPRRRGRGLPAHGQRSEPSHAHTSRPTRSSWRRLTTDGTSPREW